MNTSHTIFIQDARELSSLNFSPVDLVVTSPPYPMIQMWDDLFTQMSPEIGKLLAADDPRAFALMCDQLDIVWEQVDLVLKPGGIVCINIGDATRSIGGTFQLFPSHTRVIQKFLEMGYVCLPEIIWKKPTNSPNKFLGSGMLPPNAYVTLEHEYILIFRKGSYRRYDAQDSSRHSSAYFWEERNEWFSDIWEIRGTTQLNAGTPSRNRTAAYPLEIPFRLIHMFSTRGDTVLDPFLGTGTTTVAAISGARNSIGIEIDPDLVKSFLSSQSTIKKIANTQNLLRVTNHLKFIEQREKSGKPLKHHNIPLDLPVVTKQETALEITLVSSLSHNGFVLTVDHTSITPTSIKRGTKK